MQTKDSNLWSTKCDTGLNGILLYIFKNNELYHSILILTPTFTDKEQQFSLFLLYFFNDIRHHKNQFLNPQHVMFGK